jgi:phosphatidylglycerophosphate synthase
VRSLSYLPNLLSSLRITLAPGMLGAAYSNSKTGFVTLLCFAILTDALDGFLARRLKAESEMGRRLDRWGDALTVSLGAVGIYFLWPAEIENEWQATLLALAGYFVVGVDRLWLRPDRDNRPSWCDWLFVLLLAVSNRGHSAGVDRASHRHVRRRVGGACGNVAAGNVSGNEGTCGSE